MRRDVAEAYVERLIQKITNSDRALADDDGDYPVRYRSALYYVRLVGEAHADVQVFAVAVDDVEPSAALLSDINELNTQVRFARTFHVRGQVLVEADLTGDALEPVGFFSACEAVATITDRVASDLAKKHGGRTAFEDSKDDGYHPPDAPTGMYL